MNKDNYKNKVYTHLNNTNFYQKINTKTLIRSFLETLKTHQHINEHTFKFLTPPIKPQTSLFYILPKIHKPSIPGRPIVSSINSLTENISEFLTLCIQPLVTKLKSHIKDTTHFLKKIKSYPQIRGDTLLVSADIISLYTNIPHEEGIDACIYFIEKYRTTLPSFTPNKTILKTLFLFVLENNYFEFENILYKQLFGTAMGTKMAPPYTNLFLGYLEETKILASTYKTFIELYVRFLDDIFFIWNGTTKQLKTFFDFLNNIHPTIKFTYNVSNTSTNFLDSTIYIDTQTKYLYSKLYTKPTDTRTLLHYDSYYPKHTKTSIIYSQVIRYRTIITVDKILQIELKKLADTLLSRGYPLHLIKNQLRKINNISQHQLLARKTITSNEKHAKNNISTNKNVNKRKPKQRTLPFIIPYSEHFLNLKKIITKYWYIIEQDKLLKKTFPNKPFISFKRNKNLKDILIKTKFS